MLGARPLRQQRARNPHHHPGRSAGHGTALSNLALTYSAVGARQEAMAPAEETVAIWRALPRLLEAIALLRPLCQDRPSHSADLSRPLNTFVFLGLLMGQPPQARPLPAEALRIVLPLTVESPPCEVTWGAQRSTCQIH